MTATILVVDDEPAVRFTLTEALGDRGHEVRAAESGAAALTMLDGVDVVITDLAMPGIDGLQLLAKIRERDATLPVVLLTAHGSERIAVAAMRAGAHDYLVKPFDIDELALVVERALELVGLRRADERHRIESLIGVPIIGSSPRLLRVIELARRVADRDVTVLVRGDTGTGKELIASLVHCGGRRRDKPLLRFNCAAIPEDLAESELFGHVRGAFTGAATKRDGLFRAADGGTLVLDEIGELGSKVQAKLLRVLQSGEIQPVGADVPQRVDVRIVACTHRDLAALVATGKFREDLYYRLAVVELELPSLGQRTEDIPLLVDAFVRRYAARFELPQVTLTPALVEALVRRPWPGNVRELENTVARLLALSQGGLIDIDALDGGPSSDATTAEAMALRERVAAFERGLIERALADTGGNQSEAARRLGVSRVTLIDKIRRHSL
jgi:two-component system response regulator AtoC